MVAVGVAVGVAVLAPVNVADGVQVYVLAPLTENVCEAPLHIEYVLLAKEYVGVGLTVKVTVAGVKFPQPAVLVPVTL